MGNSTTTEILPDEIPVDARTASPVVAFIIGLAIILLASILNAAGLNLTKLDHACIYYLLLLQFSRIFRRFGQVQYQKLNAVETGYDHSGFSECCYTCTFSVS